MRSIIFKGPTGTGKTLLARATAYYICKEKLDVNVILDKDLIRDSEKIDSFVNSENCEYVQVHPSMEYEDLVFGPNITASGTLNMSFADKRIKSLCERARTNQSLHCIIFDDISRGKTESILGNITSAMTHRNIENDTGNGTFLCIPDNVLLIFTENTFGQFANGCLTSKIDCCVELSSDKAIIKKYYSDVEDTGLSDIIFDTYECACEYVKKSIAQEFNGKVKNYFPAHSMWFVDKSDNILEKIRFKLLYQLVPYFKELASQGILTDNLEEFQNHVMSKFNDGSLIKQRIVNIEKILLKNEETLISEDFNDIQKTLDYFKDGIIASNCVDYRGILECVIDAIVMNGILSYDITVPYILLNTNIASIPGKSDMRQASYLVESTLSDNFYYENNEKSRHFYYSKNIPRTGRWKNFKAIPAYRISYTDKESEIFLPLNGVRNHIFNVNNVCSANNAAEIYPLLWRLVQNYLKLCAFYMRNIKKDNSEYDDFYYLIFLEIKYFEEIGKELKKIGNKHKIAFLVKKILEFRLIWNNFGEVKVNRERFARLKNGDLEFTIDSYESIYEYEAENYEIIKFTKIHKMTDLTDYQKIMEDIDVRQMIFQGPPGSSKTFDSMKFILKQMNPDSDVLTKKGVTNNDICYALNTYKLSGTDYDDPLNSEKIRTGGWDLVQFHPSYGYEDFIRGIEVKTIDGMPVYNTVNKILGKIAEFAKISEMKHPGNSPHFYLLIDEINRANLAAVLGELIYGLEYRNNTVSTPYEINCKIHGERTKDICLGKNLFIVGTMNTADKSINSIDYAIRRRFIFVESPAKRSVVLDCYQNISGNTDEKSIELVLFDAVQALFENNKYFNTEFQRNDVRIGHTYFIRRSQRSYLQECVERFIFQVVPILKEYVKDGILNSSIEIMEHTLEEMPDNCDIKGLNAILSENIIFYVLKYGNLNKKGELIDNSYILHFFEGFCEKFGF